MLQSKFVIEDELDLHLDKLFASLILKIAYIYILQYIVGVNDFQVFRFKLFNTIYIPTIMVWFAHFPS